MAWKDWRSVPSSGYLLYHITCLRGCAWSAQNVMFCHFIPSCIAVNTVLSVLYIHPAQPLYDVFCSRLGTRVKKNVATTLSVNRELLDENALQKLPLDEKNLCKKVVACKQPLDERYFQRIACRQLLMKKKCVTSCLLSTILSTSRGFKSFWPPGWINCWIGFIFTCRSMPRPDGTSRPNGLSLYNRYALAF